MQAPNSSSRPKSHSEISSLCLCVAIFSFAILCSREVKASTYTFENIPYWMDLCIIYGYVWDWDGDDLVLLGPGVCVSERANPQYPPNSWDCWDDDGSWWSDSTDDVYDIYKVEGDSHDDVIKFANNFEQCGSGGAPWISSASGVEDYDDSRWLIYGGSGDDWIIGCEGWSCNYYPQAMDFRADGRNGEDHVYGSPLSNYLWGGNNNDTMAGFGGTDYMYGGYGADWMSGGADRDWLWGEDTSRSSYCGEATCRDCMYGGSGSDYLYGCAHFDEIFGGSGNDYMFGDWGNCNALDLKQASLQT